MVAVKIGGSKGAGMARPRSVDPDLSDPRGQLGAFLRAWIDKHEGGKTAQELADHMGVTPRAVRKWCEGVAAPNLSDLSLMADFMGYSDWSKLAAAIVRFSER